MPQALVFFNAHRADTTNWGFTAGGINRLGYDLLRNGYPAQAEDVFRLNVTLHPDDGPWYDSWADALAMLGRTGDAIALYRRALQLRPDAKDSADKLKALLETGAVSPK
jgi:Flp pilus assembly protein TadD